MTQAVAVGLLAVVLAVFADWLLFRPANADAWADVIRSTALALAFMAAVPAGYVAYRRQQTAEEEHKTAEKEHKTAERRHALDQSKEDQRQAELVDANVRATAKDFRDRYTAAATQIGSDKAPIRLAGVYSLAQLADEWGRIEPDQRQTCIDVLCSYLRMPWPLEASDDAADQEKLGKARLRDEETRVRETILKIIAAHLHKERPTKSGWHLNDFDLTGAKLPSVRMPDVCLQGAFIATRAKFSEDTDFRRAKFCGDAVFGAAKFVGNAKFNGAEFKNANFTAAEFSGNVWFSSATFSENVDFNSAKFFRLGRFNETEFYGKAQFSTATFTGSADFGAAKFAGFTTFLGAEFHYASFIAAEFSGDVWFTTVTFLGDAGFDGGALFCRATFSGAVDFDGAKFTGDANFDRATFSEPPSVWDATIFGLLVQPDGSREPVDDSNGTSTEHQRDFLPDVTSTEHQRDFLPPVPPVLETEWGEDDGDPDRNP